DPSKIDTLMDINRGNSRDKYIELYIEGRHNNSEIAITTARSPKRYLWYST
ncbi:MAG: hypothetical protein ACI8P2_001184, partial [Candidatus Latescibacterota bacterium]